MHDHVVRNDKAHPKKNNGKKEVPKKYDPPQPPVLYIPKTDKQKSIAVEQNLEKTTIFELGSFIATPHSTSSIILVEEDNNPK